MTKEKELDLIDEVQTLVRKGHAPKAAWLLVQKKRKLIKKDKVTKNPRKDKK